MVSDAGGPLVHRRRRELAFPIYFLLSLLVSPMLSASFFSLQTVFQPLKTLYPSSFLNGNEKISDGARRWGPAFALSLHPQLAISLPKPSSPSDATLKTKSVIIAQPYSSRSYPISPEEHSHRTSLMAGELPLGPSDAPCPVETSTVHGGSIFWAESLWFSDRTSSEIMLSLLTLSFGFTRSTPKTAPPRSILFTYPVTASISDLTPLAMSNRDSEQPINPLKRQQAPGKTLIPKWVSSFVRSPSVAGPLFFPPRPTKFSMGLTLATTWPRFVPFIILSSPNILLFHYGVENGRLQSHIILKSIVSLDKYHLLILEEGNLSDLERFPETFYPSKKPLLQPSSSIERTFARPLTSMLRNCVCFLTFCLEAACVESVLTKVKNTLSTSLCLFWNVTIQQSPETLVKLSSTHHSIVCGKLLPCSCLRCMDLSSNYPIYVIYQSLIRVLIAIFVVSNHVVDVCLIFVLVMA